MEPYQDVLRRYDLREMPYLPEIISKPKDHQPQFNLIINETDYVDRKAIKDVLKKAVAEQQPAFLFVAGEDGGGRKGVAHYILDLYIELRGIDPNRFLLPKPNKMNHSSKDVYKSWMGSLRTKLKNKNFIKPYANIGLAAELNDLSQQLRSAIKDIEKTSDLLLDFPSQIQEVADVLDPRKDMPAPRNVDPTYAAFGVLLEDIPQIDLVNLGLSIFEATQTVVIFTARDYRKLTSDRDDDPPDAVVADLVKLIPPNGKIVNAVTSGLWNQATNTEHNPCPFDPQGIEKAFKMHSRSLKLVLLILNMMLQSQEAFIKTSETWPTNKDLEFSSDQILKLVKIYGEGNGDDN